MIGRMGTLASLGRVATVACAVWLMSAAAGSCQTTALYDATGQVLDPAHWWWGWTPHNIGPGTNHQGLAIVNDAGSGINAWGIDDNSSSTANPLYSQCLDAPLPSGVCSVGPVRDAASRSGWRFSTTARFAVDHGTGASMGLALWIDNRGYFVLFDLDGNDLRATLLNNPNPDPVIMLTTGGAGATAYHDIALVYRPEAQRVDFEFDGVVRGATTGESAVHDNAMLWGSLITTGRGQMNFHRVAFDVMLPGDYGRNGVVDAADYTLWRDTLGSNRAAADGDANGSVNIADYNYWKSRFGSTSSLVLGSSYTAVAPEPSAGATALLVIALSTMLARRRPTFAGPTPRLGRDFLQCPHG